MVVLDWMLGIVDIESGEGLSDTSSLRLPLSLSLSSSKERGWMD